MDSQHTASLDEEGRYVFRVDLTLRDAATGVAVAILDTKYKRDSELARGDIYQMVTYATKLGTLRAILVYPSAVTPERSLSIRQITVQSLVFNLGEDIEEAGKIFRSKLLVAVIESQRCRPVGRPHTHISDVGRRLAES